MTGDTAAGRVLAYLDARQPWADQEHVDKYDGIAYLSPPFDVQLNESDLRALLAENQAMRDAITRVWQLDLRGIDHQWWIRDRDLQRVLHGDGVLDELAEQAHLQQPPHRQRAPLHPSVECMDQLCPQHEAEREQEANLRAARDMLRRPDQLATGTRMTVREERYDRDGQLVYASEPIAVPDDAPLQFPLAPLHWPGKGSGIPASTTYCGIDRDKHTAHVTVFADEVTCPECTAMIGPLDAEETDSA